VHFELQTYPQPMLNTSVIFGLQVKKYCPEERTQNTCFFRKKSFTAAAVFTLTKHMQCNPDPCDVPGCMHATRACWCCKNAIRLYNVCIFCLQRMLDTLPAHHLADLCASLVNASFLEKLQVLDAVDLSERLKKALPLLVRQIEGLEMLQKSPNSHTEKRYTVQPTNRVMVIRPQRGVFSRSGQVLMPTDEEEEDELQELENKLRYELLSHCVMCYCHIASCVTVTLHHVLLSHCVMRYCRIASCVTVTLHHVLLSHCVMCYCHIASCVTVTLHHVLLSHCIMCSCHIASCVTVTLRHVLLSHCIMCY